MTSYMISYCGDNYFADNIEESESDDEMIEKIRNKCLGKYSSKWFTILNLETYKTIWNNSFE
jgi:hypothetical protein